MLCHILKSEREWLSMFNILFNIRLEFIKYITTITSITSNSMNNKSITLFRFLYDREIVKYQFL